MMQYMVYINTLTRLRLTTPSQKRDQMSLVRLLPIAYLDLIFPELPGAVVVIASKQR